MSTDPKRPSFWLRSIGYLFFAPVGSSEFQLRRIRSLLIGLLLLVVGCGWLWGLEHAAVAEGGFLGLFALEIVALRTLVTLLVVVGFLCVENSVYPTLADEPGCLPQILRSVVRTMIVDAVCVVVALVR